jgi:hypothetical protein
VITDTLTGGGGPAWVDTLALQAIKPRAITSAGYLNFEYIFILCFTSKGMGGLFNKQ